MGKSVDLPDPLHAAASQPLGNADDLLAELAGEEVDRLLAEADADGRRQPKPGETRRAADVSADLAAAVTGPPPESGAIQRQLDALFGDTAEDPPEPESAPEPPATPAWESVAPIEPEPFTALRSKLPDDIDAYAVMAAILGDPPLTLPAPVTEQAIVPAPTTQDPAKSTELATTVAERRALTHVDPADELPGPGELAALKGPMDSADETSLPVYLKPLEWMNAPLDLFPTTFRDVLGQVAILTLLNAIAVLIYVFVFRNK